ncbi:B12-binding domain-containing radical SAM protein [Paucidesulfovibrio longus]|uniref:B12-binding domain-containing radical SAM protein n=1 Tax=Paucidesulfovibrio longus TaxID=889 RepID=UPI0003B466E7|nr:radical SAM protein [Paucidesulfovibrio longus]
MKILLINSGEPQVRSKKTTLKQAFPFLEKFKPYSVLMPRPVIDGVIGGFGMSEKRFPVGLGYLSSMLKNAGHEVELLDRFCDNTAMVADFSEFDFIGIYASTPCFSDTLALVEAIDASGFQGRISVGGPHATLFPGSIPDSVHYVVQGEGEYVINDVVEGKYPSHSMIRTQRIKDLDQLPRPDYELFLDRPRPYNYGFNFAGVSKVYNMNTSRSCPMSCSFCSVRDIWGNLWTHHSAERVVDDIHYLQRTYGVDGIYFREDFFPASKKRLVEICELIIRDGLNISWACETRADTTSDEEIVRLMARAGCVGLYIGAESGSDKMLKVFNKRITSRNIVRTCANAHKYGIAIAMSLIVAHPEETYRDKLDTFSVIRTTKPETLYINVYRDEFARHGMLEGDRPCTRRIYNEEYANGTWAAQRDRLRVFSTQDAVN